ncbi:uncharacterized protein LOC112522524 isoform X2 [Cynara cardunculus var. scolymus]|uniref:uncharacterized protein LOC112522524 isoform X2 n=1 Tax=Cynara cardunculus var. scolymus TaxID=59895 RepID=UPI000D6252EC|nr:uncharacterized protein LOC112522524 isoform X2 [Cynara cardunculus var. scolymus]
MGSRGGGGSNGGGSQGIPAASRKMVQSLKEIVNGVPEAEIYSTLKDCNMDPNEAVNRLLSQDTFHEVKSKREKKKEFKDTTEPRPRGGGSTSTRGARSGTDRYGGRSGSTQFNSSESGGLHGKPTYKRENGMSSYAASTAPVSKAAPRNANWHQSTFSDAQGPELEVPTFNGVDGVSVSQPSSGYQSAWLGASGQKSMADIVKMGRPQNKGYSTSNPSQQSINQQLAPPPPPNVSRHELPSEDYASQVPEIHPDYGVAADQYASPDNEWPSIEQPQAVGVHSVLDNHAESGFNSGQSSLPFERSNQYQGYETNEVEEQDESCSEDDIENNVGPASIPSRKTQEDTSVTAPLYDNDSYGNMDSYHPHDAACEHKEEEGDPPISSVSANIQNLSIQEEKHMEEPEEDGPSVVIPNHLQVHTADCSHLSFGSFGASMNSGFSGPFASRTLMNNIEEAPAEPVTSSVDHSENTNLEYYEDGSTRTSESNLVQRTGASAENYDLPSASQSAVLKQEDPEVIHGNQYGFPPSTHAHTFNAPQLLNSSFPQSQTPAQTQISTPFLNVMQGAHTNSLPSTLLAANGHPVRESDLSYSQFSVGQSLPTRYGNSVSSISDPTISMTEALKTVGLSSSQPAQHTPAGNTLPTGPTLPQHLAVHPYSQPTLPLGAYANMISYPFLPQSYTYMPSGFQPAFAGNSTYHQQLAAILPQYKNSVSVSSLPPQSAAVASGYGSFGNSTPIPGNYQVNQPAGPAGSTLSYEDVLNAHYKDNNQLLSLQQQNENSPMWVHGGGSRGVPASAYYGLQSQNQQQASGFRQGQQSYGGAGLNYQDFFHSQGGGEHQNPNPRGGEGSQGQPKLQSQQLWQNSY